MDAQVTPLPIPETTPPVTKMYFGEQLNIAGPPAVLSGARMPL
jgi:hypothetical protein